MPVREAVRLDVPLLVVVLVPEAVSEEEAVPVPTGVLLKEMDGVTVCVAVIVTVAVFADVPVPVRV